MLLWNLLTEAAKDAADEGAKKSNPTSLIIMGVLIVGVIGLFIWSTISNKKKQKKAQEMVSSLKIGDRVKTIGGICGFVAQINDAENTFVLETGLEGNKSYVKFDRGAIYQTAPAVTEAPAPAEEVTATAEEKKAPAKKTTAKKTATKKAPAKKAEEKAE
ncbi:MAG: preprotein translocase subunit YajC [Clostridia bacterium]|nr:preprotein translocase subunit YajC [Clostridia bacterium]